jgi:tetratricopeptide (TPR) repeat protein
MTRSSVSRYNRKRARALGQDRFQTTSEGLFERLGDRLEGKGRTILYSIGALIALGILFYAFSWYRAKHADEARAALGRAIEIANAPIGNATPTPGAPAPPMNFKDENERAQKAVEEFQRVAAKYGEPYRDIARYMAATNMLVYDRAKGVSELEDLSKNASGDTAAQAKFALAQAKEAEGKFDEAAALYNQLLKDANPLIPPDTVNLSLARVYEKQGKKNEAADILFKLVETARTAKDKDGKPKIPSQTARAAADRLQALDPTRYAQLPPEPTNRNLPF